MDVTNFAATQQLITLVTDHVVQRLDVNISSRLAATDQRLDELAKLTTTLSRLPTTVSSAAIAGAERLTTARAARLDLRTCARKTVIIQTSGDWIVPTGVYSIDVVLVGGGGAGGSFSTKIGGSGVSGEMLQLPSLAVTAGQTITLLIGGGGIANGSVGAAGGTTSVTYQQWVATAAGGAGGSGGAQGMASTVAKMSTQQNAGTEFNGGNGLLGSGGVCVPYVNKNGAPGTGLGSGGAGAYPATSIGGSGAGGGVIISYWQEI